jgi:hypothetical protein
VQVRLERERKKERETIKQREIEKEVFVKDTDIERSVCETGIEEK